MSSVMGCRIQNILILGSIVFELFSFLINIVCQNSLFSYFFFCMRYVCIGDMLFFIHQIYMTEISLSVWFTIYLTKTLQLNSSIKNISLQKLVKPCSYLFVLYYGIFNNNVSYIKLSLYSCACIYHFNNYLKFTWFFLNH